MLFYIIITIFASITLVVLYYKIIKNQFVLKNSFKLENENIENNKISLLTYNIQRLPYLFRPNVNIKELMKMYDIICLQENFCSLFGTNRNCYEYNCVHPSGSFFKLTDSGLSIYSKYKIKFINFIRFNNLNSVDKLSDKGFLIVKINDLFVVNTHLQSIYNKDDKPDIAYNQLRQILSYCNKFNNLIICGDFNICLSKINDMYIKKYNYSKIITDIPTHWNSINGIFNDSYSYQKSSEYLSFYYDGGFYKNIFVDNIKTVNYDKYTDHLGVSFTIQI